MTEFGEQYSVQRSGEMFGPISRPLPSGIGQRLDDAIKSMIQESKWTNGVLFIGQTPDSSAYSRLQGGLACALLVTKNNYYTCDPHSRDRNGRVVAGASILLHFTIIRQFCSYIQELGSSLNSNYCEITIVSVNSLLFERYVTDQKRMKQVNLETSSSTLTKREREGLKCEQNCLGMVKKHQELTCSNKEKTKNAESKQEKRNNPQVKEKEAELKRQKRSDPKVKDVEAQIREVILKLKRWKF